MPQGFLSLHCFLSTSINDNSNANLNLNILDIIALTTPRNSSRLAHVIKAYEGQAKVEVFVIDEQVGTADALRSISHKIKNDFMVVSADLLTDAPMHHFMDRHRLDKSMLTFLLAEHHISKEPEFKDTEFDIAVLDAESSKILQISNESMLDDALTLPFGIMQKYPNLQIRREVRDLHCYLFKKQAIELLNEKKHFQNLKDDFIPWLMRCNVGQCSAFFVPGGMACRVNSLEMYLEMNRQIARAWPFPYPKISSSADIPAKSQVGNDSVVGDNCKLGERTTVKKSVIGNNVVLGVNCKIIGSVLMDGVVVGDNVKLENCIVGSKSFVKDKASLVHSEVACNYTVDAEVVAKNEVFI